MRRGFHVPCKMICSYCHHETLLSTSSKHGKMFEVNRRMVTAFKAIGKGQAAQERFCSIMNMPQPLSPRAFSQHSSAVHDAVLKVSEKEFQRAANLVKTVHQELDSSQKDVYDVEISIDGTWMKRGFSSLYGCVFVISEETGLVMDFVVLSKYCKICEIWSKRDSHSPEYLEWKKNHEDLCSLNFKKSSKAMEAEGAVMLFSRSVEKLGLQYTSFIADGDSSSYKAINDAKPYGEVKVHKKDCVGHVQKRMGTGLRKVVAENKGNVIDGSKGLGGRRKLTKKLMDTIQNYYGLAIRRNKDDLPAAKQAVQAILLHMSSSDTNSKHHLCPQGELSWCGWQRDRAGHTSTYKHKEQLSPAVVEIIQPLFDRLSSDAVLETAVAGQSQNANESLHHLLWQRCPKVGFAGLSTVECAAALAAVEFNRGATALGEIIQEMGFYPGAHAKRAFRAMDRKRVYHAEKKSSKKGKRLRKQRRAKRKGLIDKEVATEELMYEPGAFIGTEAALVSSQRRTPMCKKCGRRMKGHKRGAPCPDS